MKLFIKTKEKITMLAADQYEKLLNTKPTAILGLATGSTPLGLYKELICRYRAGKLSFAQATSFNLDEYAGLPETHDQSYRYYMNTNFFEHIDIPMAQTHVPPAFCKDDAEAESYDRMIEAAGGIDLQLLGIGNNGHIAFNEPGTPFGAKTHLTTLTESTRQANARFFSSIDKVPTHAVTMGLRSIMNARSVVILALGKAKAAAVKARVEGPVCEDVPASVLQLHPDVTIYLDEEAASLLE